MSSSQRSVEESSEPTAPSRARSARIAVTTGYIAQGLGYAVVVTSLPALKERQSVDDTVVTLLVLTVALSAAVGSLVANAVAVRFGSRTALTLGLAIQALALPVIAAPTAFPVFAAAFAVFGVGLGCVDAAAAMQGVTVQRSYGRHLLGGFFAAATAAGIAGALLVSTVAFTTVAAGLALAAAAVVAASAAVACGRWGAREVPIDTALAPAERRRLPRAAIWAFGLVILAVFVSDSAVSTWSSVYLHDDLGALPWVAPLGYAAYQAVVLLSRLATDRLVPAVGRRRLVAIALVVSAIGCALVALVPATPVALAGFALAGLATGILVPVTFGAAGEIAPDHSDQVIARVNLFNYAGAILGAVAVGALADTSGIGPAFLIPAVVLAAGLAVVPRFRTLPPVAARAASAQDEASRGR